MAADPLTPEQAAREFSKPSDTVPEPPRTDPALDPIGTVRVQTWDRRLTPDVRRVVRCDAGIWVLFTGPPFGPGGYQLRNEHVRDWHVASWLTVAVTFKHSAQPQGRVVPLDGSDAEGAAPFKDAPPGPVAEQLDLCTACGHPFSPRHDINAPGPTSRHIYKSPFKDTR